MSEPMMRLLRDLPGADPDPAGPSKPGCAAGATRGSSARIDVECSWPTREQGAALAAADRRPGVAYLAEALVQALRGRRSIA